MKRNISTRTLVTAFGVALLASVTACNKGGDTATTGNAASGASTAATPALDPILADPKVGDLYAAELTAFSGMNFNANRGTGAVQDKAYGLLKVVEVTPERVTVITETGAWPKPQGARNDLRGTMSDIPWDESEKIPLNRADFARLVAEEKILETRRMGN